MLYLWTLWDQSHLQLSLFAAYMWVVFMLIIEIPGVSVVTMLVMYNVLIIMFSTSSKDYWEYCSKFVGKSVGSKTLEEVFCVSFNNN